MRTAPDDRPPIDFHAFGADSLEVRSTGPASAIVTGTAPTRSAVMRTDTGQRFVEEVSPTAFSVRDPNRRRVSARFMHDPRTVLGSERGGARRLHQDERALTFELSLPLNTQIGRDARTFIERGDVHGASVGMLVLADEWRRDADGQVVRAVSAIDVFELSLVVAPAYKTTLRLSERSALSLEVVLAIVPMPTIRTNRSRLDVAVASLARLRAGGARTA